MRHPVSWEPHREKAGTSVANNNLSAAGDVSEDEISHPKGKGLGGFSAFAAIDDGVAEEEEEDFGGLMVCVLSFSLFGSQGSNASVCD